MADYKELIKELRNRAQWLQPHHGEEYNFDSVVLNKAADAIEELQPKKSYLGEWVVCGDGENVPYLCSHCGKTVPATLIAKYHHNYCPNCGVKMRVKSDG